jgi:hypothetical protein
MLEPYSSTIPEDPAGAQLDSEIATLQSQSKHSPSPHSTSPNRTQSQPSKPNENSRQQQSSPHESLNQSCPTSKPLHLFPPNNHNTTFPLTKTPSSPHPSHKQHTTKKTSIAPARPSQPSVSKTLIQMPWMEEMCWGYASTCRAPGSL